MPKKEPKPLKRRKRSRAMSPEEQENMCIGLAYEVAEQRLRDGTATAAEVVHFLKMGSMRERYERELMESKKALEAAKTEAYASSKTSEELLREAMQAFSVYSGKDSGDDYNEY